MRRKFTAPLETTVSLTHGEETIELRVSACPLGWPSYVETMMPRPVEYVQGEARPAVARMPAWRHRSDLLMIARCLGDQLDTPLPTGGTPAEWERTADAIGAEFEAAGLTAGDLDQIAAAIRRLNQGGTVTPGKAPS